MKKLASVLILVFAFTLTTQAQKKRKKRMHKDKLTVEQQATLAVKKMALELDLTDAQQRKLKPLVSKQITERRAQFAKMKKLREEKKKLEANERYKKADEMLDKRLAFQKEMKSILNAEQYEKFKETSKKRKKGMKRKGMKKKMKHLKEKKKELEENEDN